MSPVGKAMLELCDANMVLDLDKLLQRFPNLHRGQLKLAALQLGLQILGGS